MIVKTNRPDDTFKCVSCRKQFKQKYKYLNYRLIEGDSYCSQHCMQKHKEYLYMNSTPQYKNRNIMKLDETGNYYYKHVDAMTEERLESKNNIAAELAYRDMVIDTLEANLQGKYLDGSLIPTEPFSQK